jgi:hypothetical protein
MAAGFLVVGVVGFAASSMILPLVVFGAMGAMMLVAGERTKVQISSHGVTSIPPFGRSRSYQWSDIDAFAAQRIPGGYGSWAASMRVSGGWVYLAPTRRGGLRRRSKRAVEQVVEQLNADLRRAEQKRDR